MAAAGTLRRDPSAPAARSGGVMSPRPDLGPKPHLGYSMSRIERAAERRSDAAALHALETDARARVYVVGGDLVVLHKGGATLDALFARGDVQALGAPRVSVFLGLVDGAPRCAMGVERAVRGG